MTTDKILPSNHYSLTINKDIMEICLPFFKRYNIGHFAYIRHFDDGSSFNLLSDSDLYEHHMAKQYQCYPDLPKELLLKKKFHYFVMPGLEDGFNEVANDYIQLFNIHHPIYFFERHDGFFDLFVFALNTGRKDSINFYFNNYEILENFKFYFKDKARSLIMQSLKNKLKYPVHMLPTFSWDAKDNAEDLSLFKPNRYIINSNQHEILFSARQMQIIELLTYGETAKEISMKLQISFRTVEFHINEIKLKLGVSRKHELIKFFRQLNYNFL